jgi:alkanesulfonate monooxygenase
MKVFWFFPTAGDGRYLASSVGGRAIDLHYLKQIAQAVDELGYYGALLPTGRPYEDTWVVASAMVTATRRMKFIVAVRPGLMSPTLSARMTATLDRLSEGRVIINIVTAGDPVENAGDGLHLSHDDRYALTDEFLHVWRGILSGQDVTFKGKHIDIRGGKALLETVQKPYPPLYLGGSSEAALDVTARHIDTYLTWGEPVDAVAEKVEAVRRRAADHGRTVKFGIRLHTIVRETEKEAWAEADSLIKYVDDATIAAAQKVKERTESVGQKRMTQLHNGRKDSLVVGPNLWAGVGLVRGGCGTALVGDPENVASRIREYQQVGIEEFIFSGYPHLEESYRVAELLFPLIKPERPGTADAPIVRRHRGEAIAHTILPGAATAPATR